MRPNRATDTIGRIIDGALLLVAAAVVAVLLSAAILATVTIWRAILA